MCCRADIGESNTADGSRGDGQRGLVAPANLAGPLPRAHRADAWRRCAEDPATLLQWIARWDGAGAPRAQAPRRDRDRQNSHRMLHI
jgi:hypothetical protein